MGYKPWSEADEKEFLRLLHLQKEIPDWEEISKLLKEVNVHKTATQCYMRWHRKRKTKEYNFNFSIGNKSWTIAEEEEFIRILGQQKKYPDWREISKQLKEKNINYSSKQCYNKWHRNKKKNESYNFEFNETKLKKLKYNVWTKTQEYEFLRILHLHKEYPDWKEISKLLKDLNINMTPKQCYNKWHWLRRKKNNEFYNFKFRCKTWTKGEEKEFLRILNLQKEIPDWEVISNLLKKVNVDKTPTECYMRWHKNQNLDAYNFKKKEKEFTKEEEKKLFKMIFSYAPEWDKIANDYGDLNVDSKMVREKFFFIIKQSLKKACKLSYIKNGDHLFLKINPYLYYSLINKEIKIDFTEYKKFCFGIKDKDCPDFIFLSFFEFIHEIYFEDYEKISEKNSYRISERGMFIIKKVVVYLIQMNLNNNYSKNRNYLLKFQKKIIENFKKDEKIFEEGKNFKSESRVYMSKFHKKIIENFKNEQKKEIETMERKKDEKIFEQCKILKSGLRIFLEDDNMKNLKKKNKKKSFFNFLIFERLKEKKNEIIIEKKFTVSYNPKTKIVFIKTNKNGLNFNFYDIFKRNNTETFLKKYSFN